MMKHPRPKPEGWEKVADWYDKLTGEIGHYYQREIILPKILHFLKAKKVTSVLDLACGQGVLARVLPQETDYCGVDISASLIRSAERTKKSPRHAFLVGDVASPSFALDKKDYDAVTIILALQDVKEIGLFLKNAALHLKPGGMMILVMNHPCFRIPRQSQWIIDDVHKLQSRQIKAYLTPFDIPIKVHPGSKEESQEVIYHHYSLSDYSKALFQAGCCIELLEEWTSNKTSTGPKARMENRARQEFPLFLCLSALKRIDRP